MQRYPKIAVVILNWNGKHFLSRFLPSVCAATHPNTSIYVVDNGSSDESLMLLEADFPQVKIIKHAQNYGFTTGYNLALAQIEADYFVLLNSDVAVAPDWLAAPLELLERDPQIGALQPKILAWHNPHEFEYAGAAGGWLDYFGYPFCRGRIMDTTETDTGQYDKGEYAAEEIFWASGAALFIRAHLYKALGGLDDSFFAHFEEIDLCWRIRRAGYKVVYCGRSVVWHVGGGTLQKSNPFKIYLNYRNNWAMLVKNLSLFECFSVLPMRFLLDGISMLLFLSRQQWADAKAVLRAHWHIGRQWPKLIKARKICRQQIEAINPLKKQITRKGRYKGSIVFDYFVRKKYTFNRIVTNE